MCGRSLQIAWQAEDAEEAMKAAYRAEANGPVRTRLRGLWLLRAGWSLRMVAELLGTRYRSVQRWVAWHREGDLAGVRALGLPLVEQPPVSPEPSPAKRVFEELRRAVEGNVYATLEDEMEAVGAELARIEASPDRVRKLTDWIMAAVQ
jgi:hypothetical protein